MSHLLHRSTGLQPEVAIHGKGINLTLQSGRQVIDGSGGAAVACLGHGNARIIEAITKQASRVAYAHTGFFTSEPAEELAELLTGDSPGGLTHVYFISSGSEAVEAALKLARQYVIEIGQPQRVHFISRRQSYHGNTLGALAAGGNMARRAPYEPILSQSFSRVSPCFAYHGQWIGESDTDYVARLAAELDQEFQRVGTDKVIAFIAEPVVGATSGCVTALPGYFKAVREVCDRHGALLILDEVMCGMGRTGTTHAWEQEGVVPDIQTVAKGLGGGYQPIGGILVSGKVMQALVEGSGAFVHGHTYQAHPVACAAALEVQRIIREEDLLPNVKAMGDRLSQGLKARLADSVAVGDVRGRGLFWALEFVADRESRQPFDPALKISERVKQAALDNGLAVYPTAGTVDGRVGDHVIIAPPFNVEAAQIDEIIDRIGQAVDKTFA